MYLYNYSVGIALFDMKLASAIGVHRVNLLEPSGSFSCSFKQCYSYESTI